jgi:AcrR family transcriptional regulator
MKSRAEARSAPPAKGKPRVREASAVREPRGARRKRETREKLLRAAFALFAERGADVVSINEITEAADVGFGSFFNHFSSKTALYEAVVDAVFGDFADTLERATREIEDPAEVIAICIRSTIMRARAEPSWGRFFVHEGLTSTAMTRGLGARLQRDIQRAIAAKRLAPSDPMMALMLAGGGVLATVAAQSAVANHGSAAAKRVGIDADDLAGRAAAAILEALGLARAEAAKLAVKPLPPLEAKALFA